MAHIVSTLLEHLKAKIKSRLNDSSKSTTLRVGAENDWPDFSKLDDPLSEFISQDQLSPDEITLLILALAPHIKADFFDNLIQEHFPEPTDFPQFGGVRGKSYRGFMPTAETALFILAGDQFEKRCTFYKLFEESVLFTKTKVLWLEDVPYGEPRMSGALLIAPAFVNLFLLGKIEKPRFSINFPAQLIETKMTWDDLVLNERTTSQIKELENWIKHGQVLFQEWELGARIKPGYRVLFYGAPGTGKTLTATLLGKYTGKDVYRVDLSAIVSKYIGETEKNLANLFSLAENKNWILFFDEADALFGKRTGVKDAHDKYANQEVSYLLQRIESYDGLVILASNFRDNIDEAFIRRFNGVIHFPKPNKYERLRIWNDALPKQLKLGDTVTLDAIAEDFELTGANIVNIIQQTSLKALAANNFTVDKDQLQQTIRAEFTKEGRML